jgi:hypothetical protein
MRDMQTDISMHRIVGTIAFGVLAVASIALGCAGKAPHTTSKPALNHQPMVAAPAQRPAQIVQPKPEDFVDIAVGYDHACALRGNGQVLCWGIVSLNTEVDFESLWPQPKVVEGLSHVVRIAAAEGTTCALTRDDQVKCWGPVRSEKAKGLINIEGIARNPIDMVMGTGFNGAFGCVLYPTGKVACWNQFPEPVAPVSDDGWVPPPSYATSIARAVDGITGAQRLQTIGHIGCAARDDRLATCWGDYQTKSVTSLNDQAVYHPYFLSPLSAATGPESANRCERGKCWGVELWHRSEIPSHPTPTKWVD